MNFLILSKPETGNNIFCFQIWKFFKNLIRCQTIGKEFKHIAHTNSHPANTGAASALFRVYCDSLS